MPLPIEDRIALHERARPVIEEDRVPHEDWSLLAKNINKEQSGVADPQP